MNSFSDFSSPVRQESLPETHPEDDDAGIEAFRTEALPRQKTRKQVMSEGIDRRPMLTVQEIRAIFSKGTGPVFPKEIFSSPARSPQRAAEVQRPAEVHRPPDVPSISETSKQQPCPSPPQSPTTLLNQDEFLKIAELHGCTQALDYFLSPRLVHLVIKPAEPGPPLVKAMHVQFTPEHRLLTMIRKNTTRYIRLNDIIQVDARDSCLGSEGIKVTKEMAEIANMKPLALYFTTTDCPMILMFKTQQEKEMLLKLCIFLRELLKTERALAVFA